MALERMGERPAAGAFAKTKGITSRMSLPYISSRAAYNEACQLLSAYGDMAGDHAIKRAEQARSVGNHVHFCHWRQIERLLVIMAIDRSIGTIH